MKTDSFLLGIAIGGIIVVAIVIIILISRRKGITSSKTSENRETVYAIRTNKYAPLTLVVIYRKLIAGMDLYRCKHIVLNTRSSFERGKGFTVEEALDNDHTKDLGELEVLSRLDDLPVVAIHETVNGKSKIVYARLWSRNEQSNMTLGALMRYMKKHNVAVAHEVMYAIELLKTFKEKGTFF